MAKVPKSSALILHEKIEKKGQAAPLPKNYPYERRMRRVKAERSRDLPNISILVARALSPWKNPLMKNAVNGISSAIRGSYQPRGRSFSLISLGTTGPASRR